MSARLIAKPQSLGTRVLKDAKDQKRQSLINDVRTAIWLYQNCSPEKKTRCWTTLSRKSVALDAEIKSLMAWMRRAWNWCDANREHPEAMARESRLISAIRDYEAMRDELERAEAVMSLERCAG